MINQFHHADCLEFMPSIPDKSINLILCDLPYGTTNCSWDIIIPFEALWKEYKRIIKPNCAILLFGSEPFSSHLRMWDKKIPTGMSFARFRPMQQTENISVFALSKIKYKPQMIKRDKSIKETTGSIKSDSSPIHNMKYMGGKVYDFKNHVNLISIPKIANGLGTFHPTQKPVELFEYLIKTYTDIGDTVLDNCSGSGTTAIAAHKNGRNFICIEKEQKYIEISKKRFNEFTSQQSLFTPAQIETPQETINQLELL